MGGLAEADEDDGDAAAICEAVVDCALISSGPQRIE